MTKIIRAEPGRGNALRRALRKGGLGALSNWAMQWLYWNGQLYRVALGARAAWQILPLADFWAATEEMRFKTRYRLTARLKPETDAPKSPPLIILGLYRSGTTLTASLVEAAGVDLGPFTHRLAGIGRLKELNPDGFQENFLMNDLGRYILYRAGGSGVDFPAFEKLSQIDLNGLPDTDFAYYSQIIEDDDRIEPAVRTQVLHRYNISNLNQYLYDHFYTSSWGFKDVHAGLYLPIYLRKWRGARFVCVFRNPALFLESSAKFWRGQTAQSWIEYYERVIRASRDLPIFWVCYEDLIAGDEAVLRALFGFVQGRAPDGVELDLLASQIKPARAQRLPTDSSTLAPALAFYARLGERSAESVQRYGR